MKRTNTQLTSEECAAKAQVYEEMADHILMNWTDDPLERRFAKQISENMRKRADRWFKLSHARKVAP